MLLENLFPEVLTESPLRLKDVDANQAFERLQNHFLNKKLFRTLDFDKRKVLLEVKNSIEIYRLDGLISPNIEIFGVNRQTSNVVYYVRFEKQSADFIGIDWATQVLVWGGVDPLARDLPQYVFFKYVLEETGSVVSDCEQTPRGEMFWQRMIPLAFRDNLNVYLVNFNTRQVSTIDEYEEYLKLYNSPNSPWGDKKGYHDGLRIAISRFDLN